MPPTIAARWMTWVQPRGRGARLGEVAQVARAHLAALAHPLRRLPLVGHADVERRVAQQPADDGGADRARAPRDQDAAHGAVSAATSAV